MVTCHKDDVGVDDFLVRRFAVPSFALCMPLASCLSALLQILLPCLYHYQLFCLLAINSLTRYLQAPLTAQVAKRLKSDSGTEGLRSESFFSLHECALSF
jgi:hypothetical protein